MRATCVARLAVAILTFFSGVVVAAISDRPCGIDDGTLCESGYVCRLISSSGTAKECVQDDNSGHYLFKRQSTLLVVGPQDSGVQPRLNIVDLQANFPDLWTIFLAGMDVLQSTNEGNAVSYYQMAGIHGRPFISWPDLQRQGNSGYCTHGSVLFPTFHRPYLSLFEQQLVKAAVFAAGQYAAGPTRDRYLAAARNVRLPYWDWSTNDSRIPPILMQSQVRRTVAVNGQPVSMETSNPLFQYNFRDRNRQIADFDGAFENMAATRRYPTPDGRSSQNNAADTAMRNTYNSRRQNTYNLYSITNYNQFSNTGFVSGTTPLGMSSIEAIHNSVHGNVGGTGGHMSLVDYSAFDPIFYFHHCNIDRLTTLYQAIFPNSVITPQPARSTFDRSVRTGDTDNVNTPLRPFFDRNGQLFTSASLMRASSTWDLGYEYRDVPSSLRNSPTQLANFARNRVNTLYAPQGSSQRLAKRQTRNTFRREWICHVVFDPSEVPGSGNSPECLIFLGQPTSDATSRKLERNLVGTASAFGGQLPMMDMRGDKFSATIPLTDTLEQAGVDINNSTQCVEYLKNYLRWTFQRGKDKVLLEKVPSLLVGVSAANVTYGDSETLPQWGEFETFYEITETKKSGMTLSEKGIVKSIDVSDVLSKPLRSPFRSFHNMKASMINNGGTYPPAVGLPIEAVDADDGQTNIIPGEPVGVIPVASPRRAGTFNGMNNRNYGYGKRSDYDGQTGDCS